jgi:hypothetical protein
MKPWRSKKPRKKQKTKAAKDKNAKDDQKAKKKKEFEYLLDNVMKDKDFGRRPRHGG